VPIGVVKFAEFELDSGRYELRRGVRVLKLEKIPMELLTLLAESNGRLVSRDEIVEKIWGKDVFLDTEHGINTAIRKIRHVLGDDPEQPRFVQTVTGKGYRFIAAARSIEQGGHGDNGAGESTAVFPPPLPSETPLGDAEVGRSGEGIEAVKPVVRRSRWPIAALVVVLAGVIVVLVRMNSIWTGDGMSTRSAKPQIHSLAVLPLENLSGDPAQEYFADGMTDELITEISKFGQLRVISHSSVERYKEKKRPLAEIARELGVDAVVEGTVMRSGNRVRITARLIDAHSDRSLWAQSYERDLRDVLTLQDEVARQIATAVGANLTAGERARLASSREVNPDAHEAYLRGAFYWNWFTCEGFKKGLPYFEQSVDKDPHFALAYLGVAQSYSTMVDWGCPPLPEYEALQKSKAAILK